MKQILELTLDELKDVIFKAYQGDVDAFARLHDPEKDGAFLSILVAIKELWLNGVTGPDFDDFLKKIHMDPQTTTGYLKRLQSGETKLKTSDSAETRARDELLRKKYGANDAN